MLWDRRLGWSNCQWRCISSSGRGCPLCRSVHIIGVQPARRLLERHPKHSGFHYIGLTLQEGDSKITANGHLSRSLMGHGSFRATPGPRNVESQIRSSRLGPDLSDATRSSSTDQGRRVQTGSYRRRLARRLAPRPSNERPTTEPEPSEYEG